MVINPQRWCFLNLAIVFAASVTGQYSITFDHYYPENGFVPAQALAIEKDKNGFYWIGTESGLVRYDAQEFTIFRSLAEDTTTLSSNYISKIKVDKHHRLWIASGTELNIFDLNTSKNRRSILLDQKPLNGRILNFQYDEKNDVMWIATEYALFYNQGWELNIRREHLDIGNIPQQGGFTYIANDTSIWLANTYGLFKANPVNCSYIKYDRPGKKTGIPEDNGFNTIYPDGDSLLWIGGWIHGLYRMDLRSERMENYFWTDPHVIQNGILSMVIRPAQPEIIWLATTSGILRFNKISKQFEFFNTENKYDPYKIPGAGFCLYEAGEGLWIGTYKGLLKFDQNKHFVRRIPLNIPVSYGLKVPSAMCLESGRQQKDSLLWFASGYGDIFRFDLTKGKMAEIPSRLRPYCTGKVMPYDIFLGESRYLWTSSYKYGLFCYDLQADSFLYKPDYFRHTAKILNISQDSEKRIWLGTLNGLYTLQPSVQHIPEQENAISKFLESGNLSPSVHVFDIDKNGKIWIVKHDKINQFPLLIRYDLHSGNSVLFTAEQYLPLKEIGRINNIKAIRDGRIVLAGQNEFLIFKNSGDSIYFENINKGAFQFFGNCVHIEDDQQGNIFVSSDSGIYRYSDAATPVIQLNQNNALIGELPGAPLLYSDFASGLFIGDKDYLSFFKIDELNASAQEEVRLTGISIENFNPYLPVNSGDNLNLRYDQNNIELHFSNLSYTNSAQNLYVYELSGKVSKTLTTHSNVINFNSLSDGNYSLLVRAYNCFGYPSQKNFYLTFSIRPPFWKSWWFNFLIISLISSLIYGFFKWRELQRQKLEKLRLSIARDLHDDMGSSLSYIRMLSEKEAYLRKNEDAAVFLNISGKTSEIMENMSEIIWSINPVNDSFSQVVLKVQEFAVTTLEPSGIHLRFEVEEIPEITRLSAENRRNYYLIFKEAINNISKYARADEVIFSIHIEKNILITSIRDNGIGFNPEIITKGNGLKNMHSRAENMGGQLSIITDHQATTISLKLKI